VFVCVCVFVCLCVCVFVCLCVCICVPVRMYNFAFLSTTNSVQKPPGSVSSSLSSRYYDRVPSVKPADVARQTVA